MNNENFIKQFNEMAAYTNDLAVRKGFWENDNDSKNAEKIALAHSELSEALEAMRHGNPPDDKIPDFSGAEAELADLVIRVMDLAHARGWRLAEAILKKMEYNESRPYKHNKSF